jgi:hypothetical protein
MCCGGGDLSHETRVIENHREPEPVTWKSTETELGPEVGLNKNMEEKNKSNKNVMEGHE